MAERRMFAKTIIDSDMFIDMPMSARLLYYDLAMRADDDGFVNSPKKIMRFVGASMDDMNVLIAKQFIIPFESGVVVIKHWKIHNYIQKDRYKATSYQAEKESLTLKNGTYYTDDLPDISNLDTECIQDVYSLDTQDRLGKDRLGKDNNMSDKSDDVIPYSEIISYLNEKTGRGFRNVDANKKLIKARWNEGFKVEDFKTVIDNMVTNWSGKVFNGVPAENYLQPKTLFSNKFDNYLNQKPVTRPQDISLYEDEERPF